MPLTSVGFIGAGQMARALAKGFVQAGLLPPEKIVACDPLAAAGEQFLRETPGARLMDDNLTVVQGADVVFLAVKPQSMATVLAELAGKTPPGTLIISIAAGVTLAKLSAGLKSERVIRV